MLKTGLIKNGEQNGAVPCLRWDRWFFFTLTLVEGFKHKLAAFLDGYAVGSADWAGNKLVFADRVEFKVHVALWAKERYRR
jgi:hypothetical protein